MREGGLQLLFAYGTLGPGRSGGALAGWQTDRVRGRLFDLGPYPALVDCDDPQAGWVEGYVRTTSLAELEGKLDPYEGVAEGLYRRVALETQAGRRVWAYVYAPPLPPQARGPLSRWEGRSGSQASVPSAEAGSPQRPLPTTQRRTRGGHQEHTRPGA